MNWTKEEIELILNDIKLAIKTLGRSEKACYAKLSQLKKKNKTYNIDHIDEKYNINKKFLNALSAKTVVDAYAGDNSYWKRFKDVNVISNDIQSNFDTNFHMPASQFIKFLRTFNLKADIVDLDAFGSPWEEFEESIMIAQKGLIMTFGDQIYSMYHKSSNFLKKRYGIDEYDKFQIIESFKEKAKKFGVILKVYSMSSWKKTWRVWFIIEKSGD